MTETVTVTAGRTRLSTAQWSPVKATIVPLFPTLARRMQMGMELGMLVIVMVPREQQDVLIVLIVSRWILAVPSVMEDVCIMAVLRLFVCSAHVHQLPMHNNNR